MVDLALRAPILCTMVSTLDRFEVHAHCVWSSLTPAGWRESFLQMGSCRKESVLKMSCDLLNSRNPAGDVGMVGVKEDQLAIYNGQIMNPPSLVRIHNCFIRNESWERRGLSYDQPSIWCVMLMKFKKIPSIPLDFSTGCYSYQQYILGNGSPPALNHYISHARVFIHNKWGWSMSEIL